MLTAKNNAASRKLRKEYVEYTSSRIFGYEPPQVMLWHDNRLNADVIDQLLTLFEKSSTSLSLSRLRSPMRLTELPKRTSQSMGRCGDTGASIEHRWARERNVAVNGSLETEPPRWILEYGSSKR
jgi:hypothetical protein